MFKIRLPVQDQVNKYKVHYIKYNVSLSGCSIIYPITAGKGYNPENFANYFGKYTSLALIATLINNLIKSYSFMRSYLNIIILCVATF